jgi:hypothetical protein
MLHIDSIEIAGDNMKYGTLYGQSPYLSPSKGAFRLRMSHGNQIREFSLKRNENVQVFVLRDKTITKSTQDEALRFEVQKQGGGILMRKWETICERKLRIDDLQRRCEGETSWTSSIQLRSKETKSKANAFVRIKYTTNNGKRRLSVRAKYSRAAPPPVPPPSISSPTKSIRMCRNEDGRLGFNFDDHLRIKSVSTHASRYGLRVGQVIRCVENQDVRTVSELASAVKGLMWITLMVSEQQDKTKKRTKDLTIRRDNEGKMGIDFDRLKIVSVTHHARQQGLCVGQTIVSIDGASVSNSRDLKKCIRGKNSVVMTVH